MKARSIWATVVFAVGVVVVLQSACSTSECATDADCEATLGTDYECRVAAGTCVKRSGEDAGSKPDSGLRFDAGADSGATADGGNDGGSAAGCIPGCNLGQQCIEGTCVCDGVSCPNGCCTGNSCIRKSDCGTCGTTCSWDETGPLSTTRYEHTATLMQNGKVLVTGGFTSLGNFPPVTDTAEIYDPATNAWQSAGSMSGPRANHAALLTDNGTVLVCGGAYGLPEVGLKTCDAYRPETGTWGPFKSMNSARSHFSLLRLGSGRILALGPIDSEIYDPVSDTWTSASALQTNRADAAYVVLSSGKVLMVGGIGGQGTAEVFDPVAKVSWLTSTPPHARIAPAGVLLENGAALVAGGYVKDTQFNFDSPHDGASLFDPQTGQWIALDSMPHARRSAAAVLLASGRAMVIEGPAADIFDPTTSAWLDGGTLPTTSATPTATRLANGNILVVGGDATADIFR